MGLKFLVIGEIIVLFIVVISKLIFNLFEKHKIKQILLFMEDKYRKDKEAKKAFKECLKIIEENKNKKEELK